MSIIGAEDEDFENDLTDVTDNQCTHFNNIEDLKEHPTHLLVFLQHVILQFNSAPLLCYLHADLIKNLSAKEIKKQFVEFYNNFLDKGAILKVSIPANIAFELDRNRPDWLSDDTQRRFAQEIQHHQVSEIMEQLEDFRQKRMMGMTPYEAELVDVENHYHTDRVPMKMKEKSMAECLLEKMSETQSQIVTDEDKCQSIFSAVAVYMKHLDVKTRALDSKKTRRGFFGIPIIRNWPEDSKNKARGMFHSIPKRKQGNVDGKPKPDSEDKNKVTPDPKEASTSAGSSVEPSVLLPKPGGSISSNAAPGIKITDGSGSNSSATSNPEPPQPDDHSIPSIEDDLSPSGLGGESWEPISPSNPPSEKPVEMESKKVTRSESARVDRHSSRRRGSSRTKQSRSRSDVDLQPLSTMTSPAPLSPQHLHPPEGPLVPSEVPSQPPTSPSPQLEEIDPRLQELEQDPPSWRELAPPDALKKLSKKEIKRQEVINELFSTEHAHVRMLSVLQTVFSKPLEREELLTSIELDTIFPNLEEIMDMHYNFYASLKKLRIDGNYIVKSISTTLLNRFDGTEGDWFQKLTARFCSHQTWALDQIKSRQKKEPRFNSFIQEAESKPQCRRLQLKDIIPTEMQRLTKYPLLLENIAKNTENPTEKEKIERSAECCRKILNHVNEEVKTMGNMLTLKEYQKKLDTSGLKPSIELYTEYKNIDLTQRKMLFEGPLIWRVTKEKAVDVQCVLLGDLLVLLQRQDDKMALKCQSKSIQAAQEGKQMLSPIIKLDSVFLRDVATDRKAFYVIFTWDSGAQIYELVAQSTGEMKTWTEVIKSAVDDLKKSGAPMRLTLPPGAAGAPFSPSTLTVPMSPAENGSLKSGNDQDKDSLTDEKSDPRHKLIDFLTEKGFDVLAHSNSVQEKVADRALDEVKSLKRLLIGSISLSEDSQPNKENEEQSERPSRELNNSPSAEDGETTDQGYTEVNTNTCERAETKEEDDGSFSAPLVLSQDRTDEVCRRLQILEEQVKRLQTVEEAHHKLQATLSKFTLEQGNF